MIEADIVKQFLHKVIEFSWRSQDKIIFSYGKLVKVTDNCLVVLFNNNEQVYNLDTLLTIREKLKSW